jgi:hypothetical protein
MEKDLIIEYLRKSYFSVDGLWFVLLEEEYSFQKALELDKKVWKILPKIQARLVKKALNVAGASLMVLSELLKVKLEAEGYNYQISFPTQHHFELKIDSCPWLNVLYEANRQSLAPEISKHICQEEFKVWAAEADARIAIDFSKKLCLDPKTPCLFIFTMGK